MLYNGFTYSFIDFASHAQKSTNVALQQLAAIFAINLWKRLIKRAKSLRDVCL